jgi:hypothetical protein
MEYSARIRGTRHSGIRVQRIVLLGDEYGGEL